MKENTDYSVQPMFAYKKDDTITFVMANKSIKLLESELKSMQNAFTTLDDIYTYVFEHLSKRRLSDFSLIDSKLFENMVS